ncbi:MAG: 5-(carboxyamino)imidazole ribonucleotide mutase [Planctomycetes bacterium]|nr:5-(carboxyamino)imidazole ribonucleotide mutase [Planctomycetota bacterium]
MSVVILMGSDSDLDQVRPCVQVLKDFGVEAKVRVLSAHRTPEALHHFVEEVDGNTSVYVCAAGGAAHLGGVVASLTSKPVIGVPILMSTLGGADSLYSMAQMPGGVPVATMGIGKAGAKNAGLLAVQIISLSSPELTEKYKEYRVGMAAEVAKKDAKLQAKLQEENLL